ncbi:unnamed protein product [Phyllotreta striolata]|uniref:Uncharacterized protein n=1 Tax=Phyllotreta striolata TaxID=444603 RepID=A0A9N9TSA7_PHYSR|nr:unnamed protein product [Phyllotreta striolata]
MSDKGALSNLAVAVSGLFGMIQANDQYLGALQSFAILTTNSIVGTLQILGESLDKVFTYTSTAEKLLVYPFIVASLTDKYIENKNLSYSFIVIPIIPLAAFALGKDVRIEEFQQASTVLGSILMGYLSVRHDNPYIVATSLSHLCVMFALNANDKILNVSNRHWQNIVKCFFAFCAVKAINL